MYVCMI